MKLEFHYWTNGYIAREGEWWKNRLLLYPNSAWMEPWLSSSQVPHWVDLGLVIFCKSFMKSHNYLLHFTSKQHKRNCQIVASGSRLKKRRQQYSSVKWDRWRHGHTAGDHKKHESSVGCQLACFTVFDMSSHALHESHTMREWNSDEIIIRLLTSINSDGAWGIGI